MISLFKSERFQKEYKEFKENISKIQNPQMKKELEDLLSKLVTEVKNLDNYHSDLIIGSNLPSSAPESKTKILEIRKRLNKRLADWKEANS